MNLNTRGIGNASATSARFLALPHALCKREHFLLSPAPGPETGKTPMTLTQSLAKLIVSSSLPPRLTKPHAKGCWIFGGYPAGFTRRLPDAGLNSLHQVYRADDPPTRALLLGMSGTRWILTISIPIFAATPAW
jgi:hypothetical protein